MQSRLAANLTCHLISCCREIFRYALRHGWSIELRTPASSYEFDAQPEVMQRHIRIRRDFEAGPTSGPPTHRHSRGRAVTLGCQTRNTQDENRCDAMGGSRMTASRNGWSMEMEL